MAVILQTFGVTVTLKKLVDRANSMAGAVAAKQKAIDLTRYMTENDSIKTVKALAQPGGGFTITIADQLSTELQDTIYALVEPMDLIEIRAARFQQDFAGQSLPLIMRGFVSSIQRAEAIGDDGTPQRQVIIRGIDAGKLWQIEQVLYEFITAESTDSFLDPFGFNATIGLTGGLLPVGEYMQKLVDYMNGQVENLSAFSNQMVPKFTLKSTVPVGEAYIKSVASKNGTLWSYAEAFSDRPWNELFILDTESGPQVVFRPTPYQDLSGKVIMAGASVPVTIDVAAVEVLSLNVSRSDDRVANYFWVPPSDGSLDTGAFLTAAAISNGQPIKSTGNNDPKLYGQKMMRNPSYLYSSDGGTDIPANQTGDQKVKANNAYLAWNLQRGADLQSMNQDNSVLEEGNAVVNGREQFQIGCLLRLTRGTVVSTSYINQVVHNIMPLRSWTTALGLERGMGFYNRDQASNIPFYAEGRAGPYTPGQPTQTGSGTSS